MLLNLFKQNPLLRILVSFIIGIILSSLFHLQQSMIIILFVVLTLGFISSFLIPYFKKEYKCRWVIGLIGFAIWSLLGFYMAQNKLEPIDSLTDDKHCKMYFGHVSSLPKKYSKGVKFNFKIEAEIINSESETKDETILAYLKQEDSISSIEYGTKLIINANCKFVKNRGNPEEFDYMEYLNRKGIFRTCFLSEQDVIYCNGNSGNRLKSIAYNFRTDLLNLYKQYGVEGKSFAVVSALTLGYREDLDEDSISSFRDSGAMHIMAVSGLHVGIIQLILNLILSFLTKLKNGNLVRMIIVILLLWFYAMLTGLSPSVFRAALMFSFIQVGISIKRDISIYNIISASALVVLFTNPLQIYDVGFQFSYLAVVGIIFYYSRIYNLIKFKWWIPDKIWGLTVASFSAQLSLAPLSIYYFNQFPNYFLLTNILVIPLAFVIVILAVGLFMTSVIPIIPKLVSWILIKSATLLINFTEWVSYLPFAVSDGLFLDKSSMLIIYTILIFLTAYLCFMKVVFLRVFFISLIIGLGYSITLSISDHDNSKLVVFNIDRSTGIYIRTKDDAFVICDSALVKDEKKYSFYLDKFIMSERLDKIQKVLLNSDSLYYSDNTIIKSDIIVLDKTYRVVIISDRRFLRNEVINRIDVDLIILTNSVKCSVEELSDIFQFKYLVADSRNYNSRITKWKKESRDLGIEFYSTKDSGAFILEYSKDLYKIKNKNSDY